MKRILLFSVIVFCCFPALFAAKFDGKEYQLKYQNFSWERMGGDVNVLTTLNDNVDFLQHIGLISQSCAISLKQKWSNGEVSKALVVSGNTFDAEVYGGVNSTLKAVIGTITIGTGFDVQFGGKPASAWIITSEDPVFNRTVDLYWFQTGLNSKNQCNNVCLKFRSREQQRIVETRVVTVHDTIWVEVPKPYPVPEYHEIVVHDTVSVQTEKKPCVKISAWTSFAHDHFSDPSDSTFNFGSYVLSNFHNTSDGHFIFATEQEVTAKVCMNSCALVTNLYHEYEDGPHGTNLRMGLEKNWNQRTFLEFGSSMHFRQFIHRWTTDTLIHDPEHPGTRMIWNHGKYYGSTEFGPYVQLDKFLNYSGRDHLRIFARKSFRPINLESGSSEISGSIKLEPENMYLFLSGKYQYTPYEKTLSDSVTASRFEHISWEPRVGYNVSKSMILFLRHRGINHNEWQNFDIMNSWSKYSRRDYSAGLFYRPTKMFGIKNLYTEIIAGYTKVQERYDNSFLNRNDDLMEIKITFFYGWKF